MKKRLIGWGKMSGGGGRNEEKSSGIIYGKGHKDTTRLHQSYGIVSTTPAVEHNIHFNFSVNTPG